MTVKEAAKLWDITERRVSSLCKDGKSKVPKSMDGAGLFLPMLQSPLTVV